MNLPTDKNGADWALNRYSAQNVQALETLQDPDTKV
jgi:hypothetical protein